MIKRTTALLLALFLILGAAPVYAGAADGQRVYANAVTVTAGYTASVTIRAENFSNVAALDVYIYYDAEVLGVNRTNNGSMLSGAQVSVNTAEPGTIKLSAMSLNGISGTGSLLTVYFSTYTNRAPGTYPVAVAVGRAYDTDLAETSISSANGSVTVNKLEQTETFSLYAYSNQYSLGKGELLTYSVENRGYQAFVSGEFTVTYDHEVFAFDSLQLDEALTGEGAVYSVNSAVLGQVRIAYATDEPVRSSPLFAVKLRVIADTDGTTQISTQSANVYREDLSAYLPGSCTSSWTLEKLPVAEDHPNAFLHSDKLAVGKQGKSIFCLEKGAGVAAADFTVRYNSAVLRCVGVTVAEGLDQKGGMVVINDSFAGGMIRFSYVNMDAYDEEALPLVEILWEPVSATRGHYEITLSGVGVVDAEQNAVALEYVTDSGCVYQSVVTAPTCTQDGYTTFTCTCGDGYVGDPVEKLGHDEISHAAQAETCVSVGWHAYVTCSRCDYSTYAQIAPLGHDCTKMIIDEAHLRAPGANCTQTDTYWYGCSRCDAVSDTEYFEGTGFGPHIFTEEIKDDAHRVPGTEDPALYYYDCAYCDAMGEETFSDVIKGDVNGDGIVNEDDAIHVLRHVLMPTAFGVNQPVDFDKNGNINEDDAIRLLRYVLMPEQFPI